MEKTKRSTNFSSDEIELLKTLVHKRWDKIECKKSDSLIWKQKQCSWEELTNEYNCNSISLEHRPVNILKKKWDNIKKTVKQKVTAEKSYIKGTGGGPAKNVSVYSVSEMETLELLTTQATGDYAVFDCDGDYDHISYKNNDNEISNNPSTSKIEFNSVSSNPGKQDWDDYSPALLKTPLSKQLVSSPSDSIQEKITSFYEKTPKKCTGTTTNKKWCNLADEKMKIACLNKTKIELEISQMKEKHIIEMETLKAELAIKKRKLELMN